MLDKKSLYVQLNLPLKHIDFKIKFMNRHLITLCLPFLLFTCNQNSSTEEESLSKTEAPPSFVRTVNNNVLVSEELPAIEIKVEDSFKYIGDFYFEIIANSDEYEEDQIGKAVAAGNRYVFADYDSDQKIKRLFIVQLEGFLPQFDLQYNYNFANADFIGKNKYRHNTWFYNSKKNAEENPQNEGAKTREFLEEKGFVLEDEFMMSRFVGLASEDRKNEIILFYLEMLKETTGFTLQELEDSVSKEEFNTIRQALIERSKRSFTILKDQTLNYQ